MSTPRNWYIDERAKQLALVFLTRRDDVEIIYSKADDVGIDFTIRLLNTQGIKHRLIDIEIKGRLSLDRVRRNNNNDLVLVDIENEKWKSFYAPRCVFLFIMKDDSAYYKWSLEPVFEDGMPTLRYNFGGGFSKLDDNELNVIVNKTVKWYEVTELIKKP